LCHRFRPVKSYRDSGEDCFSCCAFSVCCLCAYWYWFIKFVGSSGKNDFHKLFFTQKHSQRSKVQTLYKIPASTICGHHVKPIGCMQIFVSCFHVAALINNCILFAVCGTGTEEIDVLWQQRSSVKELAVAPPSLSSHLVDPERIRSGV